MDFFAKCISNSKFSKYGSTNRSSCSVLILIKIVTPWCMMGEAFTAEGYAYHREAELITLTIRQLHDEFKIQINST